MSTFSFSTPEEKWTAVMRRDPTADGAFYYSVRTTGVYCRPSCSARRPLRRNVGFYPDAAAAERSGFRPCKRCRPNATSLPDPNAARVAQACRLIEATEEPPTLAALADAAGLSPHHFHRVFKRITGLTPKSYAAAVRADRVRRELTRGAPVTAAIYASGFNSSGTFYSSSERILGMSPRRFAKGGEQTQIRFASGLCSLGTIVVGASDKGVCAILLGDDPEALLRDLQDRFPLAELIGTQPEFEQWVAQVVGFVDNPRLGLALPLDIRGTAFQQRVWKALTEIPVGATMTYSEVAEKIGEPRAARAVAQACAANPVAVAIPCHRVIRQDGALSGYRWGIDRKGALLAKENRPPAE